MKIDGRFARVGVGMLQPCGLTGGSTPTSGSGPLSPHSWPGGSVLEQFLFLNELFFKPSELIENDEAHADLTEELDWYPLQIL